MEQKMIMVIHQAVGMNFNFIALLRCLEKFEKQFSISISEKNGFTSRTTIHHMVPRTFIFYSQGTRHKQQPKPPIVISQDLTLYTMPKKRKEIKRSFDIMPALLFSQYSIGRNRR
jgi:hypothetical protein